MTEFKYDYIHAGYPGKDAMRDYAHQAFGESEVKGLSSDIGKIGSFSAPSRTKMRLYKKGGHVDHSKDKKRSMLHHQQERELTDVKRLIEKEKKLKRGGEIEGGSLTNMHFPKHMGFGKSHKSELHVEKGHKMKRGGHMHKHKRHHREHEEHRASHHNRGGHLMETYGFNHGGHAEHHGHGVHHHHHMAHNKRASGGAIYEREMVGEHESNHRPHNDYESMMRGESCRHYAGSHYEDHPMHRHEVLSGLKHGGHAHHPRHMHSKFAAGGVAKMRHNQANSSGHQISSGPSRMKVY